MCKKSRASNALLRVGRVLIVNIWQRVRVNTIDEQKCPLMNSCGARETKKRHDFEYRKYFGTYTSSVIFHGRSGGGERRVEYENVSRKYENYKNSCIISIQNNKTTYEMANKTVSRVLRMPDIILRIMSSCIYFVGFWFGDLTVWIKRNYLCLSFVRSLL